MDAVLKRADAVDRALQRFRITWFVEELLCDWDGSQQSLAVGLAVAGFAGAGFAGACPGIDIAAPITSALRLKLIATFIWPPSTPETESDNRTIRHPPARGLP